MARIALVPLQELGHVLPTLHMAKALARRGHDVIYIGLEDMRATVAAEGFEHVSICPEILPPGALRAIGRRESPWRAIAGVALLAGDEDARLRELAADLFVVDRDWEDPLLALERLGAPTFLHSITLLASPSFKSALETEPDVFPPSSMRAPAKGAMARVSRHLAWAAYHTNEVLSWAAREALSLRQTRAATLLETARRRRALKARYLAARGPLRTLVLCPADLELPRPPRAHVRYAGPSIDLTRREPEVEVPADDRPLVYCAFGTQSHRFAGERALLGAIVAGAARAGVHLVMSVGDAIDSLEAPRGVTVRRRLPQLAILARAQAAIVHGGLGTIKECIWFGVPMLVLPGDHDQPANAARVAHHGLGFARARRGLTADAIAALLRRLLDEGERRERLAAWSRRFRQIEAEERHVAAIESAL